MAWSVPGVLPGLTHRLLKEAHAYGKDLRKSVVEDELFAFYPEVSKQRPSKIGIGVVKAADLAGLCQKSLVSVETQGRASAFILHG
jgi:hypothetical protein